MTISRRCLMSVCRAGMLHAVSVSALHGTCCRGGVARHVGIKRAQAGCVRLPRTLRTPQKRSALARSAECALSQPGPESQHRPRR
jgi:hypothetical protein